MLLMAYLQLHDTTPCWLFVMLNYQLQIFLHTIFDLNPKVGDLV